MQTNYHPESERPKTLGPLAARLLTALYEKKRTIFSFRDVQQVPVSALLGTFAALRAEF